MATDISDDEEFRIAVEAIDNALQKADATVDAALNAFGYLAVLTISEFPEDEQDESLELFITALRKNAAMAFKGNNKVTLQ